MPPAASAGDTYVDSEGNAFDTSADDVGVLPCGDDSSEGEMPSLGNAAGLSPPPSPFTPSSMLSDDGAPPLFSPGEAVLYLVVLALALCCMWSNFKPQILKCLQCVLEAAAGVRGPGAAGPLRRALRRAGALLQLQVAARDAARRLHRRARRQRVRW